MSWTPSPSNLSRQYNDPLIQLIRENERLEAELNKRHRVLKVLLATKTHLKRLLSFSPVIIYSRQNREPYALTFISESINQLGYEARQFLEDDRFWLTCLHLEDASRVKEELRSLECEECQISEYRLLDRKGQSRWLLDQRTLIRDETGEGIEIIGTWQDITESKRIEQALFLEKELAQVTLASIGDGVITTNALGKIEYLNPVAERLTGWTLDTARGKNLEDIFKIVSESGSGHKVLPALLQADLHPLNLLERVLSEKTMIEPSDPHLLIAKSGEEYAIAHSIAPIKNRDSELLGCVLVFRDVTKPRALARQLSWQANHDALTGLLNRNRFEEVLKEAINRLTNTREEHILCYLDLDQFKVVNDNGGHHAGDELLRQLAVVLKNQVRNSDVVARLGGDEFGILLQQCPLEMGTRIAEKIRTVVQDFRFVWQNNTFRIGISIGLFPFNPNTPNLDNLLNAADAACIAAKKRGRNRVYLYQANASEIAQQQEEQQWVNRLNQALEENRFCLYHQPILPITSSARTLQRDHVEILLRLLEPDGEIILPMAFIPDAERYGLMPKLDRWVIETFFANYFRLIHTENPALYSINISGMSINDDRFLSFIEGCFDRYHIPPQGICFEITETATIANLSRAVQFINELKRIGCYFALDDFGSGMSSFVYLKNLPVDFLKIDGYFVRNILSNSVDSVMVECIHRIGQAIGIQTIAEFVESKEILEKIRELGVDHAQGYCVAQPLPLFY